MLWIRDILVRSGSADPYHWLTDPDPALFVSGFQDANKTKYFHQRFFAYLLFFLKVHFKGVFKQR
jgi:hypothetical protein